MKNRISIIAGAAVCGSSYFMFNYDNKNQAKINHEIKVRKNIINNYPKSIGYYYWIFDPPIDLSYAKGVLNGMKSEISIMKEWKNKSFIERIYPGNLPTLEEYDLYIGASILNFSEEKLKSLENPKSIEKTSSLNKYEIKYIVEEWDKFVKEKS